MRYRNKNDWILPYVVGKKVLDLGCVDHNLDRAQKSTWLHALLVKHADTVIGVDYLQDEILKLREMGYNVVHANVESMDLGEDFEVIVAGDIIEHLSNCGNFMDQVYKHLAPQGTFLITTPNPIHLLRFIQLFFLGDVYGNKEHTCWFTPQVLKELARRSGFKISEIVFVDDTYQYHRHRIYLWPALVLNYILCFIRPPFSQTLGFALKKA